ncbi:MAG: PHP domain protein [Parcubacteria group bacterium GW2011_GWC1_38_6]|nr:MAG: PHP domain protein [Parcubacteria group bacterium GW2011_GWC1_38_6]
MKNQVLAKILNEIADYLSTEETAFKPYAYQRAALSIESLKDDVGDIYRAGGIKALEEIPGVGKSIAEKIEEYIKTGKIKYHQQLKKRLPLDIEGIIAVEGMGPKKAKALYQKLGVRDVKDLEKAAKQHKIASLFGFGEKTEKNILESITFLKRNKGRFLLGEIFPKVKEVFDELSVLEDVENISLAGSVRRREETIGDVDFLVISKNPERIMDYFVSLPGVVKIWGKGRTKSSVRTAEGFDMDIRVVPAKSYGAALQYFTGSKEHNIVVRTIAMNKGLKLSEYSLFKGQRMIASETEEEIYKILGMQTPPPEIRENKGEIEAAIQGKLPKLIEQRDIPYQILADRKRP